MHNMLCVMCGSERRGDARRLWSTTSGLVSGVTQSHSSELTRRHCMDRDRPRPTRLPVRHAAREPASRGRVTDRHSSRIAHLQMRPLVAQLQCCKHTRALMYAI